jgi:hypothetical protein
MAPEGTSEGIDQSKDTTPSPEHQASQSDGADLATANAASANRPRASTKRAVPARGQRAATVQPRRGGLAPTSHPYRHLRS